MSTSNELSYQRVLIFSVCVWLFIAGLGTLSSALYQLDRGGEILWMHLFLYKLSAALVWIIFTPLLLWITEKIPASRYRWSKVISPHLSLGIFFSIIHRFFSASLDFCLQRLAHTFDPPTYTYTEHVAGYFWSNVLQSLITYLTIISLLYAYRLSYRALKTEMLKTRLTAELTQSKLKNLKAQLQPHFIFNTLQSISALMFKNVKKAETSIAILSDLLRLSFDQDVRQKILLEEEMHFVEQYSRMLKLRYGERLSLRADIEKRAAQALVPPMLIQPFIENSIKHGLDKFDQKWQIDVSAILQGEDLVIEIRDNGPQNSDKITRGTGISNTLSRLENLYGIKRISLIYGSTLFGYQVKIQLPFEKTSHV